MYLFWLDGAFLDAILFERRYTNHPCAANAEVLSISKVQQDSQEVNYNLPQAKPEVLL
jgi:hypothetical protein